MGPDGSLLVFISLFTFSTSLWVFMDPYGFLWVLIDSYRSL